MERGSPLPFSPASHGNPSAAPQFQYVFPFLWSFPRKRESSGREIGLTSTAIEEAFGVLYGYLQTMLRA